MIEMQNLLKGFNLTDCEPQMGDILPCINIVYEDKRLIIHIWTCTPSKRQCKDIMLKIYDIIHKEIIDNELFTFDSQLTFRDADGITIHGVLSFGGEVL